MFEGTPLQIARQMQSLAFGARAGLAGYLPWVAENALKVDGVDLAIRGNTDADGGEHEVRNGLALRTDLHKLFDRGYVTVDDQMRLVVGRRLKADFDNGKSYYELSGTPLALPGDAALRPSANALAWHREHRFLG